MRTGALLALTLLSVSAAANPEVILHTGSRVIGVETPYAHAFKGITYATANRFEHSVLMRQTKQNAPIIDATEYGAGCHQNCEYFVPKFWCPKTYSDHCMELNIYVPKHAKKGSNLPVFVYIHGGFFLAGSGGNYADSGDKIAYNGDFVMVNLNYRLALMGFLRTGKGQGSLPGNFGFADQQRALEWIQEYIADFGGDPGQVTISGESAGGRSIYCHLVSPPSQHLFKHAIAFSAPLINTADHGTYFAELLGSHAVNSEKITPICGAPSDSEEYVDCLRYSVSPAVWNEVSQDGRNFAILQDLFNAAVSWGPVVDGDLIPIGCVEGVRAGLFDSKKKLIIGITKDQGNPLANGGIQKILSNQNMRNTVVNNNFISKYLVFATVMYFWVGGNENLAKVMDLYGPAYNPADDLTAASDGLLNSFDAFSQQQNEQALAAQLSSELDGIFSSFFGDSQTSLQLANAAKPNIISAVSSKLASVAANRRLGGLGSRPGLLNLGVSARLSGQANVNAQQNPVVQGAQAMQTPSGRQQLVTQGTAQGALKAGAFVEGAAQAGQETNDGKFQKSVQPIEERYTGFEDAFGDFAFSCPSRSVIREIVSNHRDVYAYIIPEGFAWTQQLANAFPDKCTTERNQNTGCDVFRDFCHPYDRTCHAEDMPWIWHNEEKMINGFVRPQAEADSVVQFHKQIGAFLRSGSPNGPGLPEWPLYKLDTELWMNVGPAALKEGNTLVTGVKQQYCDFWDSVDPSYEIAWPQFGSTWNKCGECGPNAHCDLVWGPDDGQWMERGRSDAALAQQQGQQQFVAGQPPSAQSEYPRFECRCHLGFLKTPKKNTPPTTASEAPAVPKPPRFGLANLANTAATATVGRLATNKLALATQQGGRKLAGLNAASAIGSVVGGAVDAGAAMLGGLFFGDRTPEPFMYTCEAPEAYRHWQQ